MGSLIIKYTKHVGIAVLLLFIIGFQLVHAQALSGTWTGVWNGQTINLTTVKTVSIETLNDSVLVGVLTNFHTTNPSYSCLNGESINVFTAPDQYPGEYVVHNGDQGSQCIYFTAVFPSVVAAATSPTTVSPTVVVNPTKAATGFLAVSIALIAAYAIFGILAFVLFIWMLIDCIKYQQENKVLWILLIVFVGILGPLIYYFVAKKPRDAQRKMNSQMQNTQPPIQ